MTRLRDFLMTWKFRQSRHKIGRNDAASSKLFWEDFSEDNLSLTESSFKNASSEEKETFQYLYKQSNVCKPNMTIALLLVILLIVCFIFPSMYLLHYFGVINTNINYSTQQYRNSPGILTKDDYIQTTEVHKPLYQHESVRRYNSFEQKVKVLPPPPNANYKQCKKLKDDEKLDCYPEGSVTPNSCQERGCCWIPIKKKQHAGINSIGVPYCFYPPDYGTYQYINVTKTAYGVEAYLKRNYTSGFTKDIETIKMIVKYETENRLHIKFVDPIHNRFEPPFPEIPIVDKSALNFSYSINVLQADTGFQVIRKSDGVKIFDTSNLGNMVFSNQFLQISSRLPSSYIYGLGEHRANFLLSTNWQRFTMFNHDSIPTENLNLYGSHPFYLMIEESKSSHGVFFFNSNAMDVIIQPSPMLTFRTIGGVIDLYIFLGPTPQKVVQQYLEVIGNPYMPPYWSLGFHLCRFGYKTLNETIRIMQRNIDVGIPIDTQWNDLDYMKNSNDFTYDIKNYKDLPNFVKNLHEKGMHYIPLVDPGISASEKKGQYLPYDKGVDMDIFVKNSSGQLFIGKVWNRETTVWPDFTHPHSVDYWTLMLKYFHKEVEFDGVWIDMNEPSNFLSGSFNGCPNSAFEKPQYVPGVDGGSLSYKTMCMTNQHFAGLHYDIHNLYGFTEAIVTHFAMSEIRGKRPVIITRSTFPGLGHYAGHWSGDVYSRWHDMQFTISQLLSFSLFGVPLMGADICGFNGNTTEALCNRWMQLGAFYPFSRNHNTDDGIDQDPVAFGRQVIESSKKALGIRYSLLPYLYTLFWLAHTRGETVSRPLFFEFINDTNTYAIDDQFLWGSAIMFTPVLHENSTLVNPYVPAGLWYDYYTQNVINSTGSVYNISAPLDTIPIFLRGGFIIPKQSPLSTTTLSRLSKIELLVLPDLFNKSHGVLYWDDGDSLNVMEEGDYSLIQFELSLGTLLITPLKWSSEHPPNIGLITILGLYETVTHVTISNMVNQITFSYNNESKVLCIYKLNLTMEHQLKIQWS